MTMSIHIRFILFAVIIFSTSLSGCSGLLFQPMKPLIRTPADINLTYQDVVFASEDGTSLHGWFLPAEGKAHGTIFLLHGNAENISTHIGSVYWLPPRGFNVFLFDYRGYGQSAGNANLEGSFLDIQAAFQWLQKKPDIDPTHIAVLGQSLGGAMGVYAFANSGQSKVVRALILDSVFSDYQQIAREKFSDLWLTWPLQYPLSWFFANDYSPVDNISKYGSTPVLIIQSKQDVIVPEHHGQQLFEHARPPKDLWIIPKGGHISALNHPEVRDRLVGYLIKILANPE